MNKCTNCGSYAINPHMHGRGGDRGVSAILDDSENTIGDRIIYYAVVHTHKTGVKPSVVYLGKREMQEVETLMEWGMTQCNASDLIRDMICGFEIVAVA